MADNGSAGDRPTPSMQRVRTFKPRRRALTPSRQRAFDRLAPLWMLAETGPALDLPSVFGRETDVVLEIGIGAGESLIEIARHEPNVDAIGCDVHTPGIAASLAAIELHGLTNVRVVHGDALDFLPRLPPASLAGVRVFFPDPWPKVRQQRRRLIRPDVTAELIDRVRVGGWLHLATDIDDYAAQMQCVCDASPALVGGVVERPADRPVTRYEQRGLAAGRAVTDLRYTRIA